MSVLQEEILLELREQNTHTIRSKNQATGEDINGDYNVPLETNITVNEGDQIVIKSCFIDSVDSSSGKIVIEDEDATIQVTNGLYLRDWGFADPTSTYTDERIHFDTTTEPSGKEYYLTKNVGNDGSMSEILSMRFFIDNGEVWRKTNGEDAFFGLIYQNHENDFVHLQFSIPKKDIQIKPLTGANAQHGSFFDLTVSTKINDKQTGNLLPIVTKTGTLQVDPKLKDQMASVGVYIGVERQTTGLVITPNTQVIPATNSSLYPHLFTSTFTIKTGSYTPADLADTLSKQFAKIKPDNQQFIQNNYVDSNFLFTSQELKTKPELGNGSHMLFCDKNITDVVAFASAKNYWVGSSQFGIIFNEDSGKFEIDRIHDSLFSNSGLSIIKTIVGSNGNKSVVNKTGGIFFTDLQPRSLWEEKLGFDLNSLLVKQGTKQVKTIGSLNNVTFFPMPLEDGVNITGDNTDLDALILKKVDPTANEFFDQPLASGFSDIETSGSASNPIQAKQAVNLTENDINTPYYQIELDLGVNLPKLGSDNNNNKIGAIISKFYDSGSYSSSMDNSGSRVYEHKGSSPLQLSSIGVRVLNPEGKLTTGIGGDNVVFVSVIKPK